MIKKSYLAVSILSALPIMALANFDNNLVAVIKKVNPHIYVTPSDLKPSEEGGLVGAAYVKFDQVFSTGESSYGGASFAIDKEGNLWATGKNSYANLGLDPTVLEYKKWTKTDRENIKRISAAYNNTMIETNDGNLFIIGGNTTGLLGTGNTVGSEDWIELISFKNPKDFQITSETSYIVDANNELWATGSNRYNQLGFTGDDGDYYNEEHSWTKVSSKINNFPKIKELAAGEQFSYVLDVNGDLWATGYGRNGQFGLGNTNDLTQWTKVLSGKNIVSISIGDTKDPWGQLNYQVGYAIAMDSSGKIWTTGASIGTEYTKTNTWKSYDNSLNFKEIEASMENGGYLFALTSSDELYFVGRNYLGILEEEPFEVNKWTSTGKNIKSVSKSPASSMYVDDFGDLWGTGYNNYGQLGLIDESYEATAWTRLYVLEEGADTDGDGVTDFDEIKFGTDPADKEDKLIDSDGDGIYDNFDIDNDNDGFYDDEEIESGTDPLDSNSHPDKAYSSTPEQLGEWRDNEDYKFRNYKITKDVSFYDDGREFNNYSDDTNGIITFTPPAGRKLAVSVNYVELNNPSYQSSNTVDDYLSIYRNGVDEYGYLNSDDEIVSFPNNRYNQHVYDYGYVSEATDGSVTFEWYTPSGSDNATDRGWDIDIILLGDDDDYDKDGIYDLFDKDDDNDNYSDKVEEMAGTDSKDANSHPSFIVHPVDRDINVTVSSDMKYYDNAAQGEYEGGLTTRKAIFKSDNGDVVKAIINMLDIREGPDSLSIYDGENTNTLLDRCTSSDCESKEFVSSNDALTFVFESSASNTQNKLGWDIDLEKIAFDPTDTDNDGIRDQIDPDDDNDGFPDVLENKEGTDPLDPLSKPNYVLHPFGKNQSLTIDGQISYYDAGNKDGLYFNNSENDKLTLTSSDGRSLFLAFDSFKIEKGSDYLRIYDGNSSNLVVDCGLYDTDCSNYTYISSSDTLIFDFYSDYSSVYEGWSATVEPKTIPETDTDNDGIVDFFDKDDDNDGFSDDIEAKYNTDPLDSNSFPNVLIQPESGEMNYTLTKEINYYDIGGIEDDYPVNQTSEAVVRTDDSSKVKITFNYASIENGYDFLRVYDGLIDPDNLIIACTGSNCEGQTFTSTGDTMSFDFISDSVYPAEGWEATLSKVE